MRHLSKLPCLLVLTLGIGACTAPPAQFLLDAPGSTLRLSPVVNSLEIRTVSLPRYASADGLTRQQADAALITDVDQVWADSPERGATLAIVRNISEITGARVASEPWPFADLPAASVTVTVEQFLATSTNVVRLSGSYAVAPVGSNLSDRAGRFAIEVPILDENGAENAQAVANAHAVALRQLSETIARRISR